MPTSRKTENEKQTSIKPHCETGTQGMEERLMAAIQASTKVLKDEQAATREEIRSFKAEIRQDLDNLSQRVDQDLKEAKEVIDEKFMRMEKRLDKLEYHSKKYNLIFHGIRNVNKGDEKEALVKLCTETLKLETMPLIANCHGIGSKGSIIARFMDWDGRTAIMNNLKLLKGTDISVQTDLPSNLFDKRNELLVRRKALKAEGKQARVVERAGDIFLQTRANATEKWVNVK